MTNISVLILTKNEQQDLPGCLESVTWSDDIHLFDSMSSDNTVKIAEKFGATVTRKGYPDNNLIFGGDEAAHRNWGLKNIPFKYPWVFSIDADERATPELLAHLKRAVQDPGDNVAFRIRRRDYLFGTWLKHVQASPFYLRLIRPDKVSYQRQINPVPLASGAVGQIAGYLDHFPFSKGMSHWLDRHNAYSTLEAREILSKRKSAYDFSIIRALTATDFHERRAHQKALFYRIPFRPVMKFLLLYVVKRGFLDGRAGFTYALLQSIYEYFIVLKVHELMVNKPISNN